MIFYLNIPIHLMTQNYFYFNILYFTACFKANKIDECISIHLKCIFVGLVLVGTQFRKGSFVNFIYFLMESVML